MPQLDPSSFSSQLFWLALTFIGLYWLLATFCLPKIAAILQQREQKIQGDIAAATQMKQEAEALDKDYNAALQQAKAKAAEIFSAAQADISKTQDAAFADLQKELDKKFKQAEGKLETQREKAKAELSEAASELAGTVVKQLTGNKVTKTASNKAVKNTLNAA